MNEIEALNDRLTELNDVIESEEAKKNEFSRALKDKMTIGDQLDDTLRTVTQKINQLEKIEYPGENEREMLVSF